MAIIFRDGIMGENQVGRAILLPSNLINLYIRRNIHRPMNHRFWGHTLLQLQMITGEWAVSFTMVDSTTTVTKKLAISHIKRAQKQNDLRNLSKFLVDEVGKDQPPHKHGRIWPWNDQACVHQLLELSQIGKPPSQGCPHPRAPWKDERFWSRKQPSRASRRLVGMILAKGRVGEYVQPQSRKHPRGDGSAFPTIHIWWNSIHSGNQWSKRHRVLSKCLWEQVSLVNRKRFTKKFWV